MLAPCEYSQDVPRGEGSATPSGILYKPGGNRVFCSSMNGNIDIEIAVRSPDHLVNSLYRLDGVTEPVDCLTTTSPEFS